jgi:hypothetical protein
VLDDGKLEEGELLMVTLWYIEGRGRVAVNETLLLLRVAACRSLQCIHCR